MAKRIRLSKVEDTFVIEGRGLIIIPGIPYPSDSIRKIRVGEGIVLIRPDGSELNTTISSIEMIHRKPPVAHAPFAPSGSLTKEDVPIGTEVWLCD